MRRAALVLLAACGPARPTATLGDGAEPGAVATACATLHRAVRSGAVDAQRPWTLTHALLAEGPSLRVPDGRLALDALGAWAVEGDPLAFPRSVTRDGLVIPVEPHASLVARTLVAIGLPASTTVRLAGVERPVGDLLPAASARLATPLSGDILDLDDRAWALHAVAGWRGAPVEARDTMLDALDILAAPLQARRLARAALVKDGAGLFALSCGGAHLLHALVVAGAAPDRLAPHVELHRWRLAEELRVVDEARARWPEQELVLLSQRLKQLGHWLEVERAVEEAGLGEAEEAVALAQAELAATTRGVELLAGFVFPSQDLLGDAAHAAFALERWGACGR